MFLCSLIVFILAAFAGARFNQEQVPIPAIEAITGGPPGVAATLAGNSIQFLLASADPCGKLQHADAIIAQLGNASDAVAAARGLVAAEQNFNPFDVSIPSICPDPTLPTSEVLRGVVPLVDPAVIGSEVENALSKTTLTTPFNAVGMSVAQVMIAAGFSNFTTKALDGSVSDSSAATGEASATVVSSAMSVAAIAATGSSCAGLTTFVTVTAAASTTAATIAPSFTPSANTSSISTAGTNPGFTNSTLSALSFGLCTPTMKFEPGLNGRKATEFTFQAIDPLVNKGQQEALNPNIIANRICDQLTNVCEADAAAKTACAAAKEKIAALGTRDVTTADAWNAELGFEGADTNPDGAPKAGLVGHT